jgi:hypothetical protein
MIEILRNPMVWLFGGLAISWILSAVAHYWYKAYRMQLEANLKHEMIRRGMSADDIVKVLSARLGPHSGKLPPSAQEIDGRDIEPIGSKERSY